MKKRILKYNKTTNSEHGMTLIQMLIILALIAIIAVLTVPKLREEMYVQRANSNVAEIAEACEKYWKWEGQLSDFNQLISKGYLEAIPPNPWGGKYVLKPDPDYKVGIPQDDEKVPEKYRLGGIAEISKVYKEGANLW